MMPTAMSTTLPRTAKALNSLMKLMGRLLDDDEDGYSASREGPPRYMKCDYCPLREFLMATRHYVAQAMVCWSNPRKFPCATICPWPVWWFSWSPAHISRRSDCCKYIQPFRMILPHR